MEQLLFDMYRNRLKGLLILIVFFQALITLEPSYASQLSLSLTQAIPTIPSDGQPHPAFYITIVDSAGKPRPLNFALNVTISCSDERVLQIQKSVIIGVTEYFAVIYATSNVIESSQVEVTASASGFQSSKVNAAVGPPAGTPQSLKVTILPNILLPLVRGEADVVVTVVDSYGNPAKARSDLSISLSSSKLGVANVNKTVIEIPKGGTSAKTKVVTTGSPGTSSITASVRDLRSDSAALNVVGPKPEKIYLWSPTYQLVGEPGYLFVGIVDGNLKPVKVVTPVTISLYSSDSTRFSVIRNVTIGAGEWNAVVGLTCKSQGQTTIYASSKDLVSTSTQVNGWTGTSQPAKSLRIYTMANSFPVDDKTYTAFLVQAVDASGYPTQLSSLKRIDIFSSNSAIMETTSYVNIPSGKSIALITAVPKFPGDVTVTAASQDLISSEVRAYAYAPMPDTISIQSPPVPSDGAVEGYLVATSGGVPSPVQQDTILLLSSSNTLVGDVVGSSMLAKKLYFTPITIKGNSPGQFFVTASGGGIPSAKIQISVLETKPSAFYISYIKPVVNYNFPIVIQLFSSAGISAVTYEPIKVNLASSDIANVDLPSTLTIKGETTEILLFGKGLSPTLATVTVSSPGFKSLTTQITPSLIRVTIQISANDRYDIGETVTIKVTGTLEDTPLQGVNVVWRGVGLLNNNTVTNSEGKVENLLTVKEGENKIQVVMQMPGGGTFTAEKTILGALDTYILVISSNAPLTIPGSGTYASGGVVNLNAPPSVNMEGIIGLLGGNYRFQQWTGAIDSTNNEASLSIGGSQRNISVKALYTEDYFPVFVWPSLIIGVAAIAVFIYFKKFRKVKKPTTTTKPKYVIPTDKSPTKPRR